LLSKAIASSCLQGAARDIAAGSLLRLAGVWGSGMALTAGALSVATGRPALLITGHLDDADAALDDLETFGLDGVHLLPAWEVDLGADHMNDEIAAERMRLCSLLAEGDENRSDPVRIIVAPIMAVLQSLPDRASLSEARLNLVRGEVLEPEKLLTWLVERGYESVEQVDRQGQFARRGGIVDIFPPATNWALRVEFFGDEIDSIRRVDLDTQRSVEQMDGCEITAVTAGRDLEASHATSLAEYLPAETLVFLHEPNQTLDLAHEMLRRAKEMEFAEHAALRDVDEVLEGLSRLARVDLHAFAPADEDCLDLQMRSAQRVSTNTHEALSELAQVAKTNQVFVYCENRGEMDRLGQLAGQSHPELAARLELRQGRLTTGFTWPGEQVVVATHHEIFHRHTRLRRIRRVRAGRPLESLVDLNEGDYVVHVSHGIARFDGLKTLTREGRQEEYLTLRFADNALLHVPAANIDLVQKYIGTMRKRPTLSKLGGSRWARQKERAAEAARDYAAEMLRIQALRQAMPGTSYPVGGEWQDQFVAEFPYQETEDQISAMNEIDRDMQAGQPMDRLLCGDVGYGKTELAMRAAFRVVEAGKQVAVLVPTTVLAGQHYQTFKERFADFPFRIEMLSRFRTASEQAGVLKALADKKVDILIGTHRLLSKDVRFADLGLAVIDEEQRFGVEHKDHLKSMRASVDVLTLTATPIPRTMHMSLLGLRDISALATPPLDRRSIHTEVRNYDEDLIRKAIGRELTRQGQVFLVHNRVQDIESVAGKIQSLVPEARIAIGHGQMHEHQLEEAMARFVGGKVDVLVCTTIIESGLDIPSANTMIIHEADRFGLAQLHQLRGRVGRYKHRAYCYLLLPDRRSVTPEAAKRLKAVEEFSDLGAGFQIAMRDLEIRGAGNILGAEQSGHIAAVGYELYCQLLEQAVSSLKGQPPQRRVGVHLELGIDSYIPRSYIPVGRQRMEIYRRLATCSKVADVRQLAGDLDDAYGKVPQEVEVLLDLAEIRLLAGSLGIESIIRMDPDLVFAVCDMARLGDLFEDVPGTARLPDDKTVHWRLPANYRQMPTLVIVLLKRLRQATQGV
jgi:transcription-repair coupling factor (superfamily II helicase)